MIEKAYSDILDRPSCSKDLNDHYKDSLELLREVVNYGSNLVPRCFVSSERTITDIVLSSLLVHAVSMLDGVEVLLSNGATFAAYVPARALFETKLYIEWILFEDRDKRAKQYFCWIRRKERMWTLRSIPGTEENEKFIKSAKELGAEEISNKLKLEADENLKRLDELLNSENYRDLNLEFERTNRNGYDRPWYSISGPNSLSDLAARLGHKGEYDIFYSQYSDVSHSQAFRQHILINDGALNFQKIRSLEGIGTLLTVSITLSVSIYRLLLSEYRSGELKNFARKYVAEWRDRFQSIKHVKYVHKGHGSRL